MVDNYAYTPTTRTLYGIIKIKSEIENLQSHVLKQHIVRSISLRWRPMVSIAPITLP